MENNEKNNSHATFASYITGFALSLVFTFTAYLLVQIHVSSAHETISHTVLISSIFALALAQFITQLFFFLHLHKEVGPRWNLAVFASTLSLVVIIIAGSLWISSNLNYNMSPTDMHQYLLDQSSF